MKSSPILFSDPMIRAIRAGIKTQTRRLAKQSDVEKFLDGALHFSDKGGLGDEMWVKECFGVMRQGGSITYRADGKWATAPNFRDYLEGGKWKPSIFMGKAQSRITLEITAQPRIERLQDITQDDSQEEGMRGPLDKESMWQTGLSPKAAYSKLWDLINKEPGQQWKDNPWVWVYTFKVKES